MTNDGYAGLCTDIGFQSLNKYGEELCGDNVVVVHPNDETTIVVLADGLGSGVKASILSTLTSKIISTMMAQNMTLADCVSAIAETLPVCNVREIAYSTFTILSIKNNRRAEVIQYDNPRVILLRNGRHYEFPVTTAILDGKKILKSEFSLEENDTFVIISDGVEHAGVEKTLNFGWQRKDIIDFLQSLYKNDYTAKALTTFLLDQCYILYAGQPGDDTTVCTVKIRRRKAVNLLIGPPQKPDDVSRMMSLFFGKSGRHIVCGGTTSTLAAEFLGKELVAGLPEYIDPEIPPTAKIEGVDLVTEGVITLSRVLEYARDFTGRNSLYSHWSMKNDGASQISRMLFEEATDVNFFVGRAINPAHQNPDLPIGFSIKMHLVDELVSQLKAMGKLAKSIYF